MSPPGLFFYAWKYSFIYVTTSGTSNQMALLGHRYDDYKVMLEDDNGNITYEYVVAKDVETAAYNALELSQLRNLTLKNVIREDQW